MKRKICIILSVFAIFAMALPVFAEEGNTVQPLFHSISSIHIGLSINEDTGLATTDGAVNAYYQVPVEILLQLQVYKNGGWQTLRSWSDSGIGIAYTYGQYAVDPGYNYRTKVTGYICNDLGIPIESETATKEVYYPVS